MGRTIEIDASAGFCFGVEKAIETAEEKLGKGEQVYGLGEMVHNEEEVDRLSQKGLKVVTADAFPEIGPAKVILRAHGEPPSTYEKAAAHGIELIDATCPIVKNLQNKIRKRYEALDHEGEQIVIFGKDDHPETIGLLGQTEGKAVVVSDPGDLSGVDPGKRVYLYSQTTMDPDQFFRLEKNLGEQVQHGKNFKPVSNCSICNQMKRRKPNLREFALSHDVIIFVSGSSSSNGRMLYEYCRLHNERSHWIHRLEDIDPGWFGADDRIGISGATSTPVWQLGKVRKYLETI